MAWKFNLASHHFCPTNGEYYREELLTLWLADQIMDVLKDEKLADEALKTVSKNIKKK